MKGLVFHTFKGKQGWSDYFLNPVDVARVATMEHRKRLFSIFDGDHPYSLTVTYNKKTIEPEFTVGVAAGTHLHPVVVASDTVKEQQLITFRYKTEEEVQADIDAVIEKQKKLDKYVDKIRNDILKLNE